MIGKKINQLATELAPVSTDLTIIGDPISGVSKKITLAQLGAIFSGAVSFYTNLAGFPATGDINVIYCAKDTQKLYLWSGSAYVEVFPSQALLDTYQLRSEKGVSNGYASLDSGGKVPISQLPSSIMEYKGMWNAATNTPTLANGTGDTGDVYICNVAGTVNFGAGPITFAVGDYVIYSGTIWQRSSGAVGTVTSVAASITGNAIGITGSPVTTSGTLAFAFAGTGAQYIKGDGTLATFPNTISQAEKLITEVYNSTGATLTKGTIVYINGGQGNLPTVTKALATGDSTSAQTFGVVQADITNNNNGYVVVAGKLSDLDTQAYTEGTQLYLSSTTAGAWTSTKQYAPAHLVYVGIVVRSHPTQGIVEVKIQNGYELDELHNVAAQTPSNNDGLFWESATSLWKNKSIATILGYTPQAQLNGTGFVKASGTTISYDNSTYVTTDTNQTITGIKTFNNITNFNQNIIGGIIKLSQGVLLSKAAGIGTDPGFVTLSVQGATGTNFIYFADGDNFLNTQRFAIPTTGTYTYTLQAASGTLAFTSDLTGGTVTSVGLSSATSGVTIGSSPITTSGTITLAIATASGSQQGLLSSTDWTTFNNKQNALTNPVTGTGTTNYLPKFTGASTIGNSAIYDNGGNILIGGTSGLGKLSVYGANPANTYMLIDNAGSGINYYAANSFHEWQTAGSTKMTLNASGNLSIGNTNDNYKLDVSGTGMFRTTSTNPAIRVLLSGNANSTVLSSVDTSGYGWQLQQEEVSTGDFRIFRTLANVSTQVLNLSRSTGAATFSSSVQGNRFFSVGSLNSTDGSFYIDHPGVQTWKIGVNNTNTSTFSIGNDNGGAFVTKVFNITNAGNVGIGTTSPASLLHIKGYVPTITLEASGYVGDTWQIRTAASGTNSTLNFYNSTQNSYPLNIDGNGRVGIGTTSPIDKLHIVGGFTSTSIATPSNTSIGSLQIGYDGTNGIIRTWNSSPLITSTYNYQAFETSGSERMRITSGGELCVGTASTTNGAIVNFYKASGTITTISGGTTSAQNHIVFANPNGNVGSIQVSGSATSFNTSSDYRLKTDFKDFSGLDLVSKIKAYDYEWKSDKSRSYGVIAHELQSVINYAVTGVKDGEQMQGVDYSKIVPVLIKAIQELNDKIK